MKYKPIIIILLLISNTFSNTCITHYNLNDEHVNFSDTTRIKNDLQHIIQTEGYRSYLNPEVLNTVAQYIFDEFKKVCDTVYYQPYFVNGTEYKNVIGSICTNKPERIVIGAHYDVAGDIDGADDNASGVAGILELSRLLSNNKPDYRIDFIAFTLEEPPYFSTEEMGSFIHAKSLYDSKINVIGMICLDMIGYYNENKNSQEFPYEIFRILYGSKGNFIGVLAESDDKKFGHKIITGMRKYKKIRTIAISCPSSLPFARLSDHINYWNFGYNALLITNTAFYRNDNYHSPSDIIGTLNINKMKQIIDEIYLTIKYFDK